MFYPRKKVLDSVTLGRDQPASSRQGADACGIEVLARYAGTRLGRQEIDGEIIEERDDALWTRATTIGGCKPTRWWRR